MLAGRWAVPLPDPAARGSIALDHLSSGAPLVIDLLPGEAHVERLSADLTRSGAAPRWVRLAPFDLDPPTLDELADAATDGAGATTLADPYRTVVVESDDRSQAARFVPRLMSAAPAGSTTCVVILHYVEARRHDRRVTHPAPLGNATLERITGGRLAMYDSVLDAGRRLRPGELTAILEGTRGIRELTGRLAARLLRDVPPRTTTLLGFASLLGYCHPRFGSLEPVLESCGHLPWWTELTDGWRRFEPAWRDGLMVVCRSDRRPQVALLGRLVGELVEDGAAAEAIELCLDAGYFGTASDLLAGVGPDLVSAGHRRAVRRWLRRLPWTARQRHRILAAQLRSTQLKALTDVKAGWRAGRTEPTVRLRHGPVPLGDPSPPNPRHHQDRRPEGTSPPPASVSPLAVQARLLGPVDISIGGHRVMHWHGRKGTLLLAYLLLHRGRRPVPRDALAATFWPDAPPDASRNRLHVTLHALRADLLAASSVPVVMFDHGYRLNDDLAIRLDTEVFERAVAQGRQAEKDGRIEAALAAYRAAAREYRGDLLSDHPYDSWTLLPREHYRVQMLDVLGRTATLTFDAGRYTDAVETAQRLLALDFCREDLHRLLMRAYSRMGRPHLSLHQFEICSQQLRRELDMAPARETVDLYKRIRARSPV